MSVIDNKGNASAVLLAALSIAALVFAIVYFPAFVLSSIVSNLF
jgi:hypothetical protein